MPTPEGDPLTIVTVRGLTGRWSVAPEDAAVIPPRITWRHDERGLPVYRDGSPADVLLRISFGAQRLMAGDTVNEMDCTLCLGDVTAVRRRPSHCVPATAFERSCLHAPRRLAAVLDDDGRVVVVERTAS